MNTEDLIQAIEADNYNDAKSIVNQILMSKVGQSLNEKRKSLGDSLVSTKSIEEQDDAEYDAFFRKAMKKFGISSPADLDTDEKKKEFFDYIDKNYKAKNESVTESVNPKDIDPTGYYAIYTHSTRNINDITGPYSSEKEAYDDHGGDVDDIFTGAEIIKKLKKGEYKNFTLKAV